MFWFVVLLVASGIMSLSNRVWGNPLAFIAAGYVAFCLALVVSFAFKAIGFPIL